MKTFKLMCCLLMACLVLPITTNAQESKQPGVTTNFDNAMQDVEVLRNYVSYTAMGDVKKMNSMLADDVMVYGLGSPTDSLTKQQHFDSNAETYKNMSLSVANEIYLAVETDDQAPVGPGEWAFAWGQVTANDKTTMRSTTVPFHIVARIENGKIHRMYFYYDTLAFASMRGFALTKEE